MFCTKCGNQVEDGASFCSKCGCSTDPTSKPAAAPKKSTGIIVGIIIALVAIIAAIVISVVAISSNSDKNKDDERDSVRVSEACANAKQIYTAVSAELTQMSIAGVYLGFTGDEIILSIYGDDGDFKYSLENGQQIDNNFDLYDYLGDGYEGYGYALINPSNYSISMAWWSEKPIPDKYLHPLTEDEMDESRDDGQTVGCYPQYN